MVPVITIHRHSHTHTLLQGSVHVEVNGIGLQQTITRTNQTPEGTALSSWGHQGQTVNTHQWIPMSDPHQPFPYTICACTQQTHLVGMCTCMQDARRDRFLGRSGEVNPHTGPTNSATHTQEQRGEMQGEICNLVNWKYKSNWKYVTMASWNCAPKPVRYYEPDLYSSVTKSKLGGSTLVASYPSKRVWLCHTGVC